MAQITAEIDLSALSITGNQTVTVSTQDIYGISLTLATLTQDFTGVSVSEFINLIRAEVNGGASGFLADNDSPTLTLYRTTDVETFIGEQVSVTFGASNFNASWIYAASENNSCSPCYDYDLYACYGNYVIDLNLTPSTDYNAIFTDKFNHNYSKAVTTGLDGTFTLDPSNFPTGFFTPENGSITMSITTTANVAVSFVIGYTSYDCVLLNIEHLTTVA